MSSASEVNSEQLDVPLPADKQELAWPLHEIVITPILYVEWQNRGQLRGGADLAASASPVLLTGPRGAGKTTAVSELCRRNGVVLLTLAPHEMARAYGDAVEEALGVAIGAAQRCSPCVLLLTGVDEVAPSGISSAEMEPSAAASLLALLSALRRVASAQNTTRNLALVLSATSPREVDARVRALCPLQVTLAPPGPRERAAMLRSLAAADGVAPPPFGLAEELGASMHGFAPSDVRALCDEARILGRMRAGAAEDGVEAAAAALARTHLDDNTAGALAPLGRAPRAGRAAVRSWVP